MREASSLKLELNANLQCILPPLEAVCRKTLQQVNRDFQRKPGPKNFRKILYVR
jgi:hypothetical protein